MKIIIRGAKKTGKSSMWNRLIGRSFTEEYTPTPQIQKRDIDWNYKVTHDRIKVEVWDVVDNALEEFADTIITMPDINKKDIKNGSHSLGLLDATTIDVMRGCNAVVIMVNPQKYRTWKYAKRAIKDIPKHISVLILLNFSDLDGFREVATDEVDQFCNEKGSHINYVDTSMKNCYGLKAVKSFLNIPFLVMQRKYIQEQLDTNEIELNASLNEFEVLSKEQDYEEYKDFIEKKKNKPETPSTPKDGARNSREGKKKPKSKNKSPRPVKESEEGGFFGKFGSLVTNLKTSLSENEKKKNSPDSVVESLEELRKKSKTGEVTANTSLESFVPEGDLEEFLWGDEVPKVEKQAPNYEDTSSDSLGGNPMVMDDIEWESDDEEMYTHTVPLSNTIKANSGYTTSVKPKETLVQDVISSEDFQDESSYDVNFYVL
eukprot:TRINITY_DN4757_c2_g1_i4.p1 TRINITY_DN4757_c2_g1~~TRINITY_DN4757_c2_g1_i4.p1  ORF type:complete len:475 (-),score=123.28 TRINITY_DN4757_c2_g1_i4:582-1874(-)